MNYESDDGLENKIIFRIDSVARKAQALTESIDIA
jgi:hypothetical protein